MGSGRKRRLDRQWRGYAMAAALALLGVGLPAALRRRHVAQIPEENPDPVLRISRDGTVLYSNAMGLKKLYELGWHPKQVVPMHFRSLVRDACEAGGYIEEEVELGEGEVFSFSVSEVAQEGYINLYGRDITERRRAEQALQESELFHRQILESIPGMVFTTRADGYYDFFSQQWVDYTGVPMSKQIGDGWLCLLHPEDRDRASAAWLAAIRGSAPYDLEYRVRRYDGVFEWFKVICRPIRGARGGVVRWFGVALDIEDLKQASEALRRSEQRLRAIFDNAGVGIMEADRDDCLLAVNDQACRILGRTREQLLSMNVHELTWSDDRPLSDRLNHELHVGLRDRMEYEKRYIRGDGSPVWVHVTVSAIRDAEGRWIRSIATVEDITERKNYEEQLKVAREYAEQARAVAEKANRAKDHFLAVLSHELRTPLTPVMMGVSLLQRTPGLEPAMHETLEMIRNNVDMEAKLIDDLLDVTRIARGKIDLNRRAVRLSKVIRRTVEVCKSDIEARRLNFGVDMGPVEDYWIEADAARLQQVFWNLLKNAIKFTPRGGYVGIRCRQREGHVVVEVNDSGIGIEEGSLSSIFNAFEQAEQSRNRQFGGLGLGLTISKALVEMHGGTISAHSEGPGKGATFRVELPLTEPSQKQRPSNVAIPEQVIRPVSILLVEDHGVTANMIRQVLIAAGHKVVVASAVCDALEAAEQQHFDLLLSDLALPDGTGYELMQELRSRGRILAGIALSGYGQEDDIRRSYSAGFAVHLTKPASRERLIEAIANIASGRSVE
ncbi:MAG: PAS domain S-box protein [Acidobacteria bacterium]|nr:PAS domain S-box protein [Acidobacteriota bacterium]